MILLKIVHQQIIEFNELISVIERTRVAMWYYPNRNVIL
jgi:hypothetical protein